jgi:hypothetical protein
MTRRRFWRVLEEAPGAFALRSPMTLYVSSPFGDNTMGGSCPRSERMQAVSRSEKMEGGARHTAANGYQLQLRSTT